MIVLELNCMFLFTRKSALQIDVIMKIWLIFKTFLFTLNCYKIYLFTFYLKDELEIVKLIYNK